MWLYLIQSPSVPADLIKARVGTALGVRVDVAVRVDVLVGLGVGVDDRVGIDVFTCVKEGVGVNVLDEEGMSVVSTRGPGPQAESNKPVRRKTTRLFFIFISVHTFRCTPSADLIQHLHKRQMNMIPHAVYNYSPLKTITPLIIYQLTQWICHQFSFL